MASALAIVGLYWAVGILMSLGILSGPGADKLVKATPGQSLGMVAFSIILLWPAFVWILVWARLSKWRNR